MNLDIKLDRCHNPWSTTEEIANVCWCSLSLNKTIDFIELYGMCVCDGDEHGVVGSIGSYGPFRQKRRVSQVFRRAQNNQSGQSHAHLRCKATRPSSVHLEQNFIRYRPRKEHICSRFTSELIYWDHLFYIDTITPPFIRFRMSDSSKPYEATVVGKSLV